MSFVPGWKKFHFTWACSSRDKSSRPSWIHLARAYVTLHFIPGRWGFSSRFIPGWHFIPVFHPRMKSSRNELIPGRNHVSSCKQQQENDQTPRWIHRGTKVIQGQKLSCKEAQRHKFHCFLLFPFNYYAQTGRYNVSQVKWNHSIRMVRSIKK